MKAMEDVRKVATEDVLISDHLADESQVRCALCPFVSHRKQFYKHKSVHKEMDTLARPYEFVKKTYHKCKLCSKILLFDQGTINDHIRKEHEEHTFRGYRISFLTEAEDNTTADKRKKIKAEPPGAEEIAINVDPVEVTNDVHEMCLARCLECDKNEENGIFLLHHIDYHLYNEHQVNVRTDRQKDQKFQIVRQKYSRCRLCWKLLLFSFKSLFLHLRTEHYITLQQYKDLYMGYQRDQYLYQKSGNLLKQASGDQASDADKTSLRDFLANSENSNLSNIPILEMVVDNDSKEDKTSIEKIPDGEIKHEPDEKPMLDHVSIPGQATDNATTSQQCQSGSSKNFDLKEEVECSSGSSTSGETRYRCPVSGCRVTVLLAGLENGAAASHIRSKHKMKLYTLRKLNLKWQRMMKTES